MAHLYTQNRGELLQTHRVPTKKPTANIYLNGERLNAFLLRSEIRQRHLLPPLLHKSTESSCYCSEARKINSGHTNWKRRYKTVSICRWHDCLSRKCQGIFKQKMLELVSELS